MNLPKNEVSAEISKLRHSFKIPFSVLALFSFLILTGLISFIGYRLLNLEKSVKSLPAYDEKITEIQTSLKESNQKQQELSEVFDNALYEDHIKITENFNLNSELESVLSQLEELKNKKDNQDYAKVMEIYTLYNGFSDKIKRNTTAKLKIDDYKDKISDWGTKLLSKEFDSVKLSITEANLALEKSYKDYLATLPVTPSTAGTGYSYVNVKTDSGSFGVHLLKVPLSSVRVVTSAANNDDCKDNCPTKSLADHIKDNGGYAGMNGTYFCPPDYGNCGGKTNSFDYAFYNSKQDKWLNKKALSWGDTGLVTFSGRSAKFYKKSSEYGNSGVDAGISNFPTLLKGGDIAIDMGIVTEYQKLRGRKGAIGKDDNNLYLALINGASITDSAYVMRSLGAKDALNIDGGGSSAMYINGGYVVGPGRSLPNAIVLVK